MTEPSQGHYPIERRAGEIERLHVQSAALAADAAIMLEQIRVGRGWRCLDLGCGPEGITDLLGQRVGASGQVVGLDADAVFLDHARERAQEPADQLDAALAECRAHLADPGTVWTYHTVVQVWGYRPTSRQDRLSQTSR